jgi:hypothetical protein
MVIYHKNTLDMGWISPHFITLNDRIAAFKSDGNFKKKNYLHWDDIQ